MKKYITLIVLVFFSLSGFAQYDEAIEDDFDLLTEEWLERSSDLSGYTGISSYCRSAEFRKSVNDLIIEVHHYDSLILDKMNDPVASLSMDFKEQAKTYKDIFKLESEYSTKNFIQHMKETCEFRREIERDKKRLQGGVGTDSYDAQILVLETETQRYLKHIDKLVSKVDDHLHFLYLVE